MNLLLKLSLIILPFSCGNPTTPEQKTTQIRHSELAKAAYTDTFRLAANFPEITDTATFINELIGVFDLEVERFNENGHHLGRINTYKKVLITGAKEELVFVEVAFPDGPMVLYPWKSQLILNKNGIPLRKFDGFRYELIDIFSNAKPFLLIVSATAKGNGGHDLYKIEDESISSVLKRDGLRTYDCHEDLVVYEPCELRLQHEDINGDGWNDIVFDGGLRYLQGHLPKEYWENNDHKKGEAVVLSKDNPAFFRALQFIFLYNPTTEHFEAAEDYKEKYQLNF